MNKRASIRYLLFLITIFFSNFKTILLSADVTYTTNTTLTADLRLSLSQRALFNTSLTLNGSGYFYQFPITPDQVLIINAGLSVTFQNILFKDFSDTNIYLGSASNIIFGNNTTLSILLDQTLTHTLMFAGNSFLSGSRNRLDLGTGSIQVQANGNLTITNINLINVSATNLGCIDNTGSINFQNVVISTPSSWNWSSGSFSVIGNMEVSDGIFVYSSPVTSTIRASSRLRLSNNLTFSYDPAVLAGLTAASQLNLVFTDSSSWLSLNGCSLYITSTGMQLLKGSLEIIGKNSLYSDATTSTNQGLIIGDGLNLTSDFQVKKFNSNLSSIDIKKGLLTYQNVK